MLQLKSLLYCDVYCAGGAQGQVADRIWFDGPVGKEGKAGALGEGGEQEMAFHHGEVEADADARARAERQVRVTGKLFLSFGGEAFRIKLLRVREVFLAAVQGVGSEQDDPVFGDAIAINLNVAQGTPGHGIDRWVEAHGFLEDLQAVGQTRQVG